MTEQELEVIAEVNVVTEQEKESDVITKMDDYEHDEAPDVVVIERPPTGPTSWEELDAKKAAMEQADNAQEVTCQFQAMVHNILASELPNKGAAIAALSDGLAMRLNETKERTAADVLTKEQHYKEVAHDDTLAVESDFQGGCPACQFGEPDIIKELSNCPYCWQSLGVSDDA